MRNKLKCFALIVGIGCASVSSAETISDSLTRIESETLVLKAREKQLEAQSNILARQSEIAVKQAVSDILSQSSVSGNPVIRAIEGIGRVLHATLQLHSGALVEVKAGDILPNGMRIISVRPNEVIAETTKKQRVRLAAASTPPVNANVPYAGAFPGPGNAPQPMLPPGLPMGRPQ
ncbi:MAG TPA: type IV pilus biogenesis protein PilP [Noviherbaspirillum sp.]|nr:type IV pilus biogenesis protein PilP [Noviherbaspirillum sp.]